MAEREGYGVINLTYTQAAWPAEVANIRETVRDFQAKWYVWPRMGEDGESKLVGGTIVERMREGDNNAPIYIAPTRQASTQIQFPALPIFGRSRCRHVGIQSCSSVPTRWLLSNHHHQLVPSSSRTYAYAVTCLLQVALSSAE